MTTRLADRTAPAWVAMAERHGLSLAVAASLAVRVVAMLVVHQPLESDALAYLTLAQHLAAGQAPSDNFGNHAFFSIGYPLVLAPAFALFGATVRAALTVNLLLAAVSAMLVVRLVRALGGSRLASTLGGLGYAVWLPGIWSATVLGRENLSVPLMLGYIVALLAIGRARPVRASVAAGLCYAAGVLAGTSVLFTIVGFGVALVAGHRYRPRLAWASGGGFVLAVVLVVTPWMMTTDALLGRAVLTTSGGFNLYIGNNPAANGRFVSMRDTPLGPEWHPRYAALGELRSGDWLEGEAKAYAAANPLRTAALGALKLALFWMPNWPDADDFATARSVAALRLVEVGQYLLIVALAAFGLRRVAGRQRWILLATIAGFWAIHAATYIIPRYRDPAMPLLIALAAIGLASRLRKTADAR